MQHPGSADQGGGNGGSQQIALGSAPGRWVLAATVGGSGMAFLDGTVVNVALPTIGREFDSGLAGLQWVLNGYLLTLAALILPSGSWGDRHGRKRVFQVGVVWFALASVACAAAVNLPMLILSRVAQGVGAALLTPGSLAILEASFRPADRPRELLRWLADHRFTFLGYREYELTAGGDELRAVPGSGLGILRGDRQASGSFAALSAQLRAKAAEPRLLVLTKANSRATVHRPAYLDYVGVKRFNAAGDVVGERRFLGLLTHDAYAESIRRVPVLARKLDEVLERAGFPRDSHDGKDLIEILETYPRDELFQTPVETLLDTALGVLRLQGRRRVKLFLREDEYGRFMSCLVYRRVPRKGDRRLSPLGHDTTWRERVCICLWARMLSLKKLPCACAHQKSPIFDCGSATMFAPSITTTETPWTISSWTTSLRDCKRGTNVSVSALP